MILYTVSFSHNSIKRKTSGEFQTNTIKQKWNTEPRIKSICSSLSLCFLIIQVEIETQTKYQFKKKKNQRIYTKHCIREKRGPWGCRSRCRDRGDEKAWTIGGTKLSVCSVWEEKTIERQ